MIRFFSVFLMVYFLVSLVPAAQSADEPPGTPMASRKSGVKEKAALTPEQLEAIRAEEARLKAAQGLPPRGIPTKAKPDSTKPVTTVGGKKILQLVLDGEQSIPPQAPAPLSHRSMIDQKSNIPTVCKEALEYEMKVMGLTDSSSNIDCLGRRFDTNAIVYFRGPASVSYIHDSSKKLVILKTETKNAAGKVDTKESFIDEKSCKIRQIIFNKSKGEFGFEANADKCLRINFLAKQTYTGAANLTERVRNQNIRSQGAILHSRGISNVDDIVTSNAIDYLSLCNLYLYEFEGGPVKPTVSTRTSLNDQQQEIKKP